MKTELFPVPSVGIGRRDYSEGIEFATQASFRGRQIRMNWTGDYLDLETLVFPDMWAAQMLFFDEDGAVITYAPKTPYHIYEIILSSERTGLLRAGFYRFASQDDVYIWNVEKWYGDIYGYSTAKLLYTSGIKTVPGRIYYVVFSEYSEHPDFSAYVTVNGLEETIR